MSQTYEEWLEHRRNFGIDGAPPITEAQYNREVIENKKAERKLAAKAKEKTEKSGAKIAPNNTKGFDSLIRALAVLPSTETV